MRPLTIFYDFKKKRIHIYYKALRKLEVEYEQMSAQLSQNLMLLRLLNTWKWRAGIPLPAMPHTPSNILFQDIALPSTLPPSILKKTTYGPPTWLVSILPLLGQGVLHLPPG